MKFVIVMSDRTGNIISTGTVTSKSTGEAAKEGLRYASQRWNILIS